MNRPVHMLPLIKCSEGGVNPFVNSQLPWDSAGVMTSFKGTWKISLAQCISVKSLYVALLTGLAGNEAEVRFQEGEGAITLHQDTCA